MGGRRLENYSVCVALPKNCGLNYLSVLVWIWWIVLSKESGDIKSALSLSLKIMDKPLPVSGL